MTILQGLVVFPTIEVFLRLLSCRRGGHLECLGYWLVERDQPLNVEWGCVRG